MRQGIGVSEGVVRAPVCLLTGPRLDIPDHPAEDVEAEEARFHQARGQVLEQQRALYEKTLRELGEAQAEVFDAHCTILEDEDSVIRPVVDLIRGARRPGPWTACIRSSPPLRTRTCGSGRTI